MGTRSSFTDGNSSLNHTVIQTHHTGNMFGVRYLPQSESHIATCGRDGRVLLYDIHHPSSPLQRYDPTDEQQEGVFRRSSAQMMQVDVDPFERSLYYACCQDGRVLCFDARCSASHGSISTIQSSQGGLNSIAFNPCVPHRLAAAGRFPFIEIYDLRRCNSSLSRIGTAHASRDYCTSCSFDKSGQRLLGYFDDGTVYVGSGEGNTASGDDRSLPQGENSVSLTYHLPRDRTITGGRGRLYAGRHCRQTSQRRVFLTQCKAIGNDAFHQKHYSKAIASYTTGILASFEWGEPSVVLELLNNRALASLRRNLRSDLWQAVSDCNFVIDLDGKNEKAHHRRALAFAALEKWELVGEAYHRAQVVFGEEHRLLSMLLRLKQKSDEHLKSPVPEGEAEQEQELPQGVFAQGSPSTHPAQLTGILTTHFGRCYPIGPNVMTEIKQACFLGPENEYIAAGTDDGTLCIACADSGRLMTSLPGDAQILNCIEPNPQYPWLIATSGIAQTIKLWEPTGEGESLDEDCLEGCLSSLAESHTRPASMSRMFRRLGNPQCIQQ